MAVDATRLPLRRPRALGMTRIRQLSDASVVGCIVVAAAVARAVAGLLHSTPRFFPDEYIYTQLAKSLGSGRLEIRGEPARFPAFLESIVTAPFWLAGGIELPVRLTQGLHAALAGLAAVPVFLIARRLGLPRWQQLACAALTVLFPVFLFSVYLTADVLGATLALAAFAAGFAALESRSTRAEAVFVVLAGLATFARVQYVVLYAAFLLAALILARGRPLTAARRHPVSTGLICAGGALALALGPSRVLGYYDSVFEQGIDPGGIAAWMARDLWFAGLATGVVLGPPAVVGLVAALARPRSASERAFGALAASLLLFVLIEAGLYATGGAERFQERYFMAVLPLLVPLACIGLRRLPPTSGRHARVGLVAATLAMLFVTARTPLSDYVRGGDDQDSPFLQAVSWVTQRTGTGATALVLALVFSAALCLSAWAALRSAAGPHITLGTAALLMAVYTPAAVATDVERTNWSRSFALGADPRWVDHSGLGDVAVLVPHVSRRWVTSQQMFWNESLNRVLVFPGSESPDAFARTPVTIDNRGVLHDGSRAIALPILVEEYGASAQLDDADLVSREGNSSLWRTRGPVRFVALTDGIYLGRVLGPDGARVNLWPRPDGDRIGVLCLRLAAPASHQHMTIEIRGDTIARRVTLGPGAPARLIAVPLRIRRPFGLSVATRTAQESGVLTIEMDHPRFVEGPVGPQGAEARCR